MPSDLIRLSPEGRALLAAMRLADKFPALAHRMVEVQAVLVPLFSQAINPAVPTVEPTKGTK